MVKTPIASFLDEYEKLGAARFHMPGHKGRVPNDITEIDGAGNLFSDSGIIAESEKIASSVFGCRTYYSTEGSSLAIRTMTALATRGASKRIVAGRNAHRSFLSAAIMLGLDVDWIFPKDGESYLSCVIDANDAARAIDASPEIPAALYLTSPDYLGNITELLDIAKVCHERGVMLLVDNAHGAYLKFLGESRHPIDLGADMCADSAHKTLPVLTGGAYLHLSAECEGKYSYVVKETLEVFASSSPSYLIMRSLDLANPCLETYPETLSTFAEKVKNIKIRLSQRGYFLVGNEPLKITLSTKPYGYSGDELSELVCRLGVVPEFHDPDYVSFMMTPDNTDEELSRLETALLSVEERTPIITRAPAFAEPRRAMSPREAFLAKSEVIPVKDAAGRVLSSASVSCPPAVPIVVCGEVIDEVSLELFEYYGVEKVSVVK